MRELSLDIETPDFLPMPLEQIKSDLRIGHTDLDELLTDQYMPAGLLRVEQFTGRTILARTHRWTLDCLPYQFPAHIVLPRGRVSAVESVVYSTGGVRMTLSGPTLTVPGTDYQEDLSGDRGRLMPPRGGMWPVADLDVISPVVITYTAGWAHDAIPEDLRRGIVAAASEALDAAGPHDFDMTKFDPDWVEKLVSARRISV